MPECTSFSTRKEVEGIGIIDVLAVHLIPHHPLSGVKMALKLRVLGTRGS